MIKIIPYEKKYLAAMCDLIQRTFMQFNKKDFTKEGRKHYVNYYDIKTNKERLQKSTQINNIAYLAIENDQVIGVVRGRKDYCVNLFVDSEYQRQGVASKLMKAYEKKCKQLGQKVLKLRSTQYAIPFYQSFGFKKTTGLRSYQGRALVQPMKKILSP